MKSSEEPQPWDPKAVVGRVNRARGNHLERTERELDWGDFAGPLKWKPSTVTDVKSGKRPLRVAELGVIARMLEVRPGYLGFDDGPMLPTTQSAGTAAAPTPELPAATDEPGTPGLVLRRGVKQFRERLSPREQPKDVRRKRNDR